MFVLYTALLQPSTLNPILASCITVASSISTAEEKGREMKKNELEKRHKIVAHITTWLLVALSRRFFLWQFFLTRLETVSSK